MRERKIAVSTGAVDTERIMALIREQQPVTAEELARLLSDELPATLSDAQKLAGIHNALRHLVDVGQLRNKGSRRYPKWGT